MGKVQEGQDDQQEGRACTNEEGGERGRRGLPGVEKKEEGR